MKLTVVDMNKDVVAALSNCFSDIKDVTIIHGDLFKRDLSVYDAIISPGNSFGILDGGIDQALSDAMDPGLQRKLQRQIVEDFHGELHVGQVTTVEDYTSVIYAPTMRVPRPVVHASEVYIAFRAAILEAKRKGFSNVITCAFGTGVGLVEPSRAAANMSAAWRKAHEPARIPSFEYIHNMEHTLNTII